MPITSTSHIINEAGPKNNPREKEYYEYQTKFTDPQYFCTHILWSIYGDVPKGISIDASSGKISGDIKWFPDQPSCQDNFPDEEMEYDGKNWQNMGRFKHEYYDFHFTIQRDTLVSGPNPSTGAMDCAVKIPHTETNNVFIREVKCHNIDNLLFIKKYLESTKTSELGEETKINVDGVVYTDYQTLKPNHKGPFVCPPK